MNLEGWPGWVSHGCDEGGVRKHYASTRDTNDFGDSRKGKKLLQRSFTLVLVFLASGCTTGTAFAPVTSPSPTAWVENCADWDEWNKPGPPFRIFANSYYVGTCGITAILITGEEGHVPIEGGTEAGADSIAKNIEVLGFSLDDVKLLLHSHEHFDHVAGLAKLQELSGAQLLASPQAAPVLRTGIAASDDPQAGIHDAFPQRG